MASCSGLEMKPRVAAAFDALASMALDTVRQWRYEPPVAGPVAFDVTLLFNSGLGSSH
jgi:hypothetical protein